MSAEPGTARSVPRRSNEVGSDTPTRKRRGRTGLVVAALFTGLTVIGGGAGFVVGAVASLGAEHHDEGTAIHSPGLHGEADGSLEGPDRD